MKIMKATIGLWLLSSMATGEDENRFLRRKKTKRGEIANVPDGISRIVGGTDVEDASQYPFFVNGRGCGGSLVASDVFLTAAHCGNKPFEKFVWMGSNKKKKGTEIKVDDDFRTHPGYNKGINLINDFQLVKLKKRVSFTPVEINFDSLSPSTGSGDVLTAIGFGALSQNGGSTDTLQEVDVFYVDPSTCDSMYGGRNRVPADEMICSG